LRGGALGPGRGGGDAGWGSGQSEADFFAFGEPHVFELLAGQIDVEAFAGFCESER
jgi:hypothetical protein